MYQPSVPKKMLWETKLRIVTSGLLDMETFVNKICVGPLLHNCLAIGNANPGFSKGGCVWMNCWLAFPWYLLDETCKLLCELNRKKQSWSCMASGAGSINHWVLVESVSNSQIGTLDLAPATVWKRICIDLCNLDDTIINILRYTVATVTPLLLPLFQRIPSTLHLGLLLKGLFWTQNPSLKKGKTSDSCRFVSLQLSHTSVSS